MVGCFAGGEGSIPTRGRADGHLVEVFPHGDFDVREELEKLLYAMDEPRWLGLTGAGFRRYNQVHAQPGAEQALELLPRDYWSAKPLARPQGWVEHTIGRTEVWVECWQWTGPEYWSQDFSKSSWLSRMLAFNARDRIGFHDGARLGYLEISCLAWRYSEFGDRETSLHFAPVTMNSPCDKLHRRAAQELADAMRERLQACSPTPRAVAARQARMDDIERAMSERERLAREDAEEGRRLERQQRMQELERREKKQASRARRRACVIYDSSYLMDGRMFLHHRLLNASTIHNIVPLQVMQEIGSMIEAGDARRSLAARGRGRILELKKEVDRRPHTLGYGETDLSALQPVPREGPLDADSDTDRRLIALAFDVLRSNEDSTVVIASSDGGIGYTVDRLRRRTGARLFRVSDARITGEIRPVEECLQAIGASDS